MLDYKSNQLSKFRTKNWVEFNDDLKGTYNTNSQIKSKTTMIKSSSLQWCIYTLKGVITITRAGDDAAAIQANERNKGVIV